VGESEPPAILTVPAEARSFQGERAGIVSRVLANAIDLAILVVVLGAGYLGWSAWLFLRRGASFRFPTVTYRGTYVVGAIVLTLLFTVAWSSTGRSYGDRLLGLRVIDRRGQRMGSRSRRCSSGRSSTAGPSRTSCSVPR